jgi:DNA uptake protein ComE-like DNA-binding protein
VKQVTLIVFIWLIGHIAIGQVTDPKSDNFLERKIENIAENSSEDIDYTNIFENLTFFQEHPLDLNFAKADELQALIMLSDIQINSLIQYRTKYGKLLSIYELQAVPGFDLPLIYQMLPYVKVDRDLNRVNISLKEMIKRSSQEIFFRVSQVIEEQKGFSPISEQALIDNPNARYLGSPQRLFTRYRLRYGNYLSAGFTAEKDAGEEFFKGSQKQGFDFMTGHLAIQNIGKLKSLNIGDYQAQFGQGLTFWSGFAFGKTADAMNIKRTGQGLRPYTSVNENLFLRGIATSWTLGKFELTGFFSNKKVNTNAASVDSLSQDIQAFSNFNFSGFHRTPGELTDKGNIREQVFGGHAAYKLRTLNIGFTGVRYDYSAPLTRTESLYNKFEFQGKSNTNIGIDYNWIFRNFNFFGEVSRSANGGMATTHGFIASLDPKISLSVLYRNFAKDYQTIYSASIAEGSRSINEKGVLIGIVTKPIKYFTVSAFFDRWSYPWLRYLVDAPSIGKDALAQINYTPTKTIDAYLRYRDRNRARNVTNVEDLDIDFPITQRQRNIRFDIGYKISPSFKFRNRVEYVLFDQPNKNQEVGFLIMQDIIYKPLSKPISFSFRYALFDTDGFNSRIYAYENDVLYSFSIPAYFYKGSRTYLTLEYNLTRKIDIWFRYAQFYYTNRTETGSGLTLAQGPLRSDFRIQVRFKLR